MRPLLMLLLVLLAGPALGQSQRDRAGQGDVRIRAYVEPDGAIAVGQLARLWIEVSTSTWFVQAPRYPELQLDGAIALMPEQLGVNFTDREGGETRTGQRQRYVIIPQRAGTFAIPPLDVTLRVSVDGKPSDSITVQTKPIELTANLPPGAEGLDPILTIRKLSVSESYDRELEGLKVGDAVTRTVILRGEDTFALALPKVDFAAIKGARIYPAQAKLNDTVNRGRYRAARTDAATYVFEREGTIALPEIAVRWWNPEGGVVEETILPTVSLTVAANPDYRETTGPTAGTQDAMQKLKQRTASVLLWLRANIVWLTLLAVTFYLLWLAGQRLAPHLTGHWMAFRERVWNSERRRFAAFRKACRMRDEDRMVASFWQWLDHLTPQDQAASLGRLARSAGDADFMSFARETVARRYGGSPSEASHTGALLRRVVRFRQRIIAGENRVAAEGGPTLNPRPPAATA